MLGPALCPLLLSICIAFSCLQAAYSRSLAVSRVPKDEEAGLVVARFRRDALPYEGEMFAYPPGEAARNEAFYAPLASRAVLARLGLGPREQELLERQGLVLGQADTKPGLGGDERLGEALQRLLEESWRRDQEAAYLANLLRAWSEVGQLDGYPGDVKEAEPEPRYPDYDELAAGRYGNRQAAYDPPGRPGLDQTAGDGGGELEQQVMRYLVGRILANLDTDAGYAPRPPRLVKRDLPEAPGPRRVRRALAEEEAGGHTNLLRVKRLGIGAPGQEEEEEDEEDGGPRDGASYVPLGAKEAWAAPGLQRIKRIEERLPGAPVRNRRYAGYQGAELAERFIKFLPD